MAEKITLKDGQVGIVLTMGPNSTFINTTDGSPNSGIDVQCDKIEVFVVGKKVRIVQLVEAYRKTELAKMKITQALKEVQDEI